MKVSKPGASATSTRWNDCSIRDAGEDAIIVVTHPSKIGGPEWPAETATVMRFRGGRAVSMRDYQTEIDARKATDF